MRVTVIGGGSWGTAFSVVLRDHGHEVTLACRSEEQAFEIMATGRNPRYLSHVDLTGVAATTIEQAPVAEANLAVVAVPECGVRRDRGGAPGHLPDPEPDEGPRPGHRQPALDARREPPRGGALRPEHRRRDLAWACPRRR